MQISRIGDFMNELKIVNIPKYNKEIKNCIRKPSQEMSEYQ